MRTTDGPRLRIRTPMFPSRTNVQQPESHACTDRHETVTHVNVPRAIAGKRAASASLRDASTGRTVAEARIRLRPAVQRANARYAGLNVPFGRSNDSAFIRRSGPDRSDSRHASAAAR